MKSFQSPIRQAYHPGTQNGVQREGDWICYHCNNLNFSFRKKCNRCKNQTRQQNQQIASYYHLIDTNAHSAPLQDQTNFPEFPPYQVPLSPRQPDCSPSYSSSENTFHPAAGSKLQRSSSFGFDNSDASTIGGSDLDWSLFLSEEEEWESTHSDSSGETNQENEHLDWEIQQMVTKIII